MTPRGSLRWRLPLLICLILATAIGAFAAIAHQRMQRVLLDAAGSRNQGAAIQLAALLTTAADNSVQQLTRLAALPAVREYLAAPTAASEAAVETALGAAPPAATTRQTIELWGPSGPRLLGVVRGDGPAGGTSASQRPGGPGPQPIREVGGVLVLEAVVPAGASGTMLLARSEVTGASSIDAIQRMLGGGAVVRIGAPGHAWTDLVRVVGPPATEALGLTEADASKRLGAVVANVPVRSAPWVVSVEQAVDDVLAPARAMLRAFALAALLIVGAAAVAGWGLTGRITKPLGALSDAASSIAKGDYARRVSVVGDDEIGRLAGAFNTMSATVEDMHARLEARVEERTRELEAFSYSVSHDLRAPLRHVLGFARLLERHAGEQLDHDGRRFLGTITEAAARMGRLIDDLLAFSRMGRMPVSKRDVSLGRLVQEAREEVAPQAGERNIEWSVEDLPHVWADPDLLRLVLVNLFSNAVKYTGPRDVGRIDVSAVRGSREVTIAVRDNGVGFDAAYAGKLFGVFQRLHRADEFEGTGIGLANVRQVIHRHGGRAWAESQVGEGATFFVSLPLGGIEEPHEES